MRRWLFLLLLVTLIHFPVQAQSPEHYVVYAWDNIIYAQSMSNGAELKTLSVDFPGAEYAMDSTSPDVYHRHLSPLSALPADSYGFVHGVWSADRQRFAYLEIQHLSANYRVSIFQDGTAQTVIQATMDGQRGFLDPLGWTNEGKLLLVERRMLHHLDQLRVWQLDPITAELLLYSNNPLGQTRGYLTRGRTASLPDGQSAFLGFEVESNIGYTFDFNSRTVSMFFISQRLPDPLPSIFELFPYRVMGIIPADQLETLAGRFGTQPATLPTAPAPFLRWSLPDANRRITCYPDSDWTRSHYNVTCPVLGVSYEKHEGTDTGGQPNGLPRNTNVFAAAPGLVVMTHATCEENNPGCGDAYGNYVGMEHVIVVDGTVQTWYTGYAHLTRPLVEQNWYISDLRNPIGLSGATGMGGPHLHVEVRYPHQASDLQWVDPWQVTSNGTNLWIGGNNPESAEAFQAVVANP